MNRMAKYLHDSWESQTCDYAIIPEIRINEAGGKSISKENDNVNHEN